MITIIATTTFERRIAKLLSPRDYALLRIQLAGRPEGGMLIPGTGGARKLRFALPGRGKSGGLRVIYYYFVVGGTIYLLDVYAKNERANLSAAECQQLKALIQEIK